MEPPSSAGVERAISVEELRDYFECPICLTTPR